MDKAVQTPRPKVVFVMGATGTGKSKLAIDIATRFSGEVVNSDKIQLHDGLPVLTNKVTPEEAAGIPHHLIGVLRPEDDCTASEFRRMASSVVAAIVARGRLPVVAGGSNSFLEELVDGAGGEFRETYDICYLWIDVASPELYQSVADRVEKMVKVGLVDEVRGIFRAEDDKYSKGIRRAIGVPEMVGYFRLEPLADADLQALLLETAIDLIKGNTKKLVGSQLEKISRLRTLPGWDIRRIDATEVFGKCGEEAIVAWERFVLKPVFRILRDFLTAGREVDSTGGEEILTGKEKDVSKVDPPASDELVSKVGPPGSEDLRCKVEPPASEELSSMVEAHTSGGLGSKVVPPDSEGGDSFTVAP
ncbi:unnamed protein product [Spirodela intermedia]|uniref:Uncharacterized protein n=2 Tax=Spirodela intermedia TaxID=51605 RepID=A0A7I8LCC9_SPIIN|nr:unnamed protein product [Spirodela intermedia]CAA6670597.1 unnamed protein product [Spirodela intermedia]CAA7407673.1 unnamed protein product [Spirodela intermedia]